MRSNIRLPRRLAAIVGAAGAIGLWAGAPDQARAVISGDAGAIEGRAVWIYDLARSAGGDPATIAQQARAAGVHSVFIKAADGSTRLSQFTATLVGELRADGLDVCAWQYVYGTHPAAEAAAGVAAVRDGAQCLIIDAEGEYDGRYAAAQRYLRYIRDVVGLDYPLGLASLPYVRLHPTFPYSVFLGPGGAQYNLPQMYWSAIGTSVKSVFARTFVDNRIYGRTIIPVGQVFGSAGASAVGQFRALTVAYGAPGISWWDWAWASAFRLWSSVGAPLATPANFTGPDTHWPVLGEGNQGDAVLWLQEHLARAIPAQRITGLFGSQTRATLATFQSDHGLTASGRTDASTWAALLELAPVTVRWQAA